MKIAIGTAQFGMRYGISNTTGKVSDLDIYKILNLAQKLNINTIDTAIDYGDAEERLGKNNLKRFNLISKLPSIPNNVDDVASWMYEVVKNSTKVLNIDQLYCLLLHKPNEILGERGDSLIKGLDLLKEKGLLKKTGISIYSPEELNLLLPKYDFQIVQSPVNLIDNRLRNSGWLKKLVSKNIEVHARSIFLQGLLLMEEESIQSKILKENSAIRKWLIWKKDNPKYSAYQVCLNYLLNYSGISKLIIGFDNFKQFSECLNSVNSINHFHFPDIPCDDENVLNPSKW